MDLSILAAALRAAADVLDGGNGNGTGATAPEAKAKPKAAPKVKAPTSEAVNAACAAKVAALMADGMAKAAATTLVKEALLSVAPVRVADMDDTARIKALAAVDVLEAPAAPEKDDDPDPFS